MVKPPNAGKGRTKGSQNKVTATAKVQLQDAFAAIGGPKRLARWAMENETEFYKLWSKLIPVEHAGEGGGPVAFRVIFEEVPK